MLRWLGDHPHVVGYTLTFFAGVGLSAYFDGAVATARDWLLALCSAVGVLAVGGAVIALLMGWRP